jgi:hypothetical protein
MAPQTPCFTIDVEDFYEGMHVLGHDVAPPSLRRSGIAALAELLSGRPESVTLFVVGRHAVSARSALRELAGLGHEIASHGPDHGRVPTTLAELIDWLKRGRDMVQDVVDTAVDGFRSPRFEVPHAIGLARFREAVAAAGFTYVSDTSRIGSASPVAELPVMRRWRIPIGGGSYQRVLPRRLVTSLLPGAVEPCVLYYHSYDFGQELPTLRSARSVAVGSQLAARSRAGSMFEFLLSRLGSRTCMDVVNAIR